MAVGIWVRLEAKPGKEGALQELLTGAVALANAEPQTVTWYAVKLGASTFAVFDTFAAEEGRQAHLSGPIAKALMARADELLASQPNLEMTEILASKR